MDLGTMETATLHTPMQMGSCRLKNRIVALPVFTGYADPDGRVSPLLLSHYTRLAASGASMVVVANVAVSPDGVTSKYNLRIDADEFVPGLAELAAAIRDQGALACIQLNHAGRFAKTDHPLLASPADASHPVHHVSALRGFMHAFPFEKRFGLTRYFLKQIAAWRRAMTEAEIDTVITQFGRAAVRAHRAGFDMIELHGANGYLLCEFLSPATNKRQSGFGGTLETRAALPLAVVQQLKRRLPPRMPLGFRLLLDEWVPGGIELTETIAIARLLEQAGISYLSAAAGTFNSMFKPPVMTRMAGPAYLREEMKQLTARVTIPTIISGRITTPALANELLEQKTAPLIGLGRALRVDMDWVKKARHPTAPIRPCMNCNGCLKRVILEQGFVCRYWPKTKQLKTHLRHMLLTRNYRCLWVIADGKDQDRFKASIPHLMTSDGQIEPGQAITLLFLEPAAASGCSTTDRGTFLTWVRGQIAAGDDPATSVSVVEKRVQHSPDISIDAELEKRNQGMVLIGRNRRQAWRERLCYRLRHKVVGLIGPNPHLRNIAVFLDFSDASLLTLAFVRHTFMNRQGVSVRFIHVLRGDEKTTARRWSRLKRVADLDPGEPLLKIPSAGPVSADILDHLAAGHYGTVIMGKRGLSGIKGLLLGSVSRGVVRGIGDRSVFLVD
jgi:2,4-dienoyl-CoA reductase (NADPH2)